MTQPTQRFPSVPHAARWPAVLAIVCFCLLHFSDNKADVDLWGNAGFVRVLPWQKGFDYENRYSFTEPQARWVNHEWLAEYLLNQAWHAGGNTGMLALKLALDLLVIALLAATMRRDGVSGPVQLVCLLLIISTMGYGASVRPHHFTYVCSALLLFTLKHRLLPGPRLWPAAALLGFVWANLHGAFFIGALLLAAYAGLAALPRRANDDAAGGGYRPREVLIALGAFVAASMVNPYGPRLWNFVFHSAGKMRPYLSEWAPFHPLANFSDHVDFMALVLVSAVALAASRRTRGWIWPGLLLTALAFAFAMRRNIPLYAIAAGFVVPAHLDSAAGAHLRVLAGRIPARVRVGLLVAFAALSLHAAWFKGKAAPLQIEIPQDRFPVDVIRFMERNAIRGNALVFFDWAEYCIWKLYPNVRVFLDGRYESCYSLRAIDDFFGFLYGQPGWERALQEYPTDILLLRRDSDICENMRRYDTWEVVYENDFATLFLKKGAHRYLANRPSHVPARRPVEFFP